MLKLFKWDFVNYIRRYYWLYASFILVFTIIVVFPDDIRILSAAVEGMAAVYSVIFCVSTMLLSASETYYWLRKETSQLELSLPVRPWQILLSKLIFSICINLSGLSLTLLLWSFIRRFGMSNIVVFNNLEAFLEYLICATLLLIVIMFSYILARSCNFVRRNAGFAAVLLIISIPLVLIWTVSLFFMAIGIWTITVSNYGEIFVQPNGIATWVQIIFGVFFPLIFIAAGFFGSSTLLKYKFE